MRVNDPSITSGSAYGVGKAQGTGAAAPSGRTRAEAGAAGAGGDRVEISSTASLLQADAALRAERVEYLRELVASGRYVVDSVGLSQRIVEQSLTQKE
mgnify:CR=1 FL=1